MIDMQDALNAADNQIRFATRDQLELTIQLLSLIVSDAIRQHGAISLEKVGEIICSFHPDSDAVLSEEDEQVVVRASRIIIDKLGDIMGGTDIEH